MNIIHLEGNSSDATVLVSLSDSKYVWVSANDESAHMYEADTLDELALAADIEGWELEEEFNLAWLMQRMPDTQVDCDSGYGEALIINNVLVACSPSLYIEVGHAIALGEEIK